MGGREVNIADQDERDSRAKAGHVKADELSKHPNCNTELYVHEVRDFFYSVQV